MVFWCDIKRICFYARIYLIDIHETNTDILGFRNCSVSAKEHPLWSFLLSSTIATHLNPSDVVVVHPVFFKRPAFATPDGFVTYRHTKRNCFVLAARDI